MNSDGENGSADQANHKAAEPAKRASFINGLVGALAACMFVLSIVGFAGSFVISLDLANHFRFQYALVLLVTTIGLALFKAKRLIWVSAIGLVINLIFIVPLYLPVAETSADADSPTVTILHFNVHTDNRRTADVAEAIRNSNADLVFLQEVNQRWLDELDGKTGPYERIVAHPRNDNFGIAGFVRIADDKPQQVVVRSHRLLFLPTDRDGVPAIELEVDVDGRPVAILSLHPLPPVNGDYTRSRNAALADAGRWAQQQSTPQIIVGDLNATPWSIPFRELQRSADLVNSQRGFGRQATWPSSIGGLGMIPIDHLLHSPDMVTTARTVGDDLGSDHRPVLVELRFTEPAKPKEPAQNPTADTETPVVQ